MGGGGAWVPHGVGGLNKAGLGASSEVVRVAHLPFLSRVCEPLGREACRTPY